MAFRYPMLKSFARPGTTESRRRNPLEPFATALKRYIAAGYKAPEAMKAVWHDVKVGRVARPRTAAQHFQRWAVGGRRRRAVGANPRRRRRNPVEGEFAAGTARIRARNLEDLHAEGLPLVARDLAARGFAGIVEVHSTVAPAAFQAFITKRGVPVYVSGSRALFRRLAPKWRELMQSARLTVTSARGPARGNPRRRRGRALTVPEQHQLRIARQTLRMHPAMARVMGGPTPAEARRIIRALRGNPAPSSRSLAEAAMQIAARGAREYLAKHNLDADPGALLETLRAWVKIKIPEALADAKAALNAGMTEAAEHTFAASMVLAGIEAAKEAGFPRGIAREPKQNPRQRVSRARFCSERVADPQAFDRRSLRTVVSRAHRVTVGCPRGQYDAARRRCRVGTRIQRILHPEGEGRCPIGGREARNPRRAAGFCRETIQPRGRYDPRSFRTVLSRGHRVVVGCPKGGYRRRRCELPLEAQAILHPPGERGCPFGSPVRARQNPPRGRRARLTTFYDRLLEIKAVKGRRAGGLAGRYRHRFTRRSVARGVDRGGWRRMRRGEVVLTGRRPVYGKLAT